MATSFDSVRFASATSRSLMETAFEAMSLAVLVVDTRPQRPLVLLANATARRCLLGDYDPGSLADRRLDSLLDETDAVLASVSSLQCSGNTSATRLLNWRVPCGGPPISTEVKLLTSAVGQRWVMLSFAEPMPAPTVFSALEHITPGLLILNKELMVTYANASAARTAGVLGGILNVSALSLIPTLGISREHLVDALAGRHYHDDAVSLAIPGARQRWFEVDVQPLTDATGISGLAVLSNEVTERRSGRSAPTADERRLLALTEHASDIITVAAGDGNLHYVSGGVRNSLGYAVEERRSSSIFEHVHPDDVDTMKAKYGELVGGHLPTFSLQYRIRHKDGSYHWLESSYVSALDNPLINGVVVNSRDVTDRRRAESQLKRLTDLLGEAQRTARMGAWEYNIACAELTWTEEMFRIYETTPATFEVGWEAMLDRCTPESRRQVELAYRAAEQTDGFDLEIEITTLENRRLWVRLIGHLEKLEGRPVRVFGSVQNIHAQKLAQIELENRTGWLKLSMKMANMHAWRWDCVSDAIEYAILDPETAHLPRVLPELKKLLLRVHPRDRATLRSAVDQAFKTQREVQAEFRLKGHDGHYRCYGTVARPLFDGAGAPSGMVGVSQDVTPRQESEARLRSSEELLRATTANTADILLLLDADFRVCFINRETNGITIDRIIGEHVSVLLPANALEGVLAKLRHVLATDATVTYEFESSAAGTETQYFENRAVLVRDGFRGRSISITVRNITERKRLEREILDVSSRERHTIGRDLHDGLGQELTGVALMLRALATRVKNRSPDSIEQLDVEQLDKIVVLVNQSIETARSLARGLLPVNQERGGLSLALRSLVNRSRELYGFEVDFRAEVSPQVTLDEASASHLYRITQEALTNAARHGNASAVAVQLLVTTSKFLLQISDNGSGLTDQSRSIPGMGLKIMKYRAGMIGATFEVGPNRPQGTVVRIIGEQPLQMSTLHCEHAI